MDVGLSQSQYHRMARLTQPGLLEYTTSILAVSYIKSTIGNRGNCKEERNELLVSFRILE